MRRFSARSMRRSRSSNGDAPRNVDRPPMFSADADEARYHLRDLADLRFSQRRRTAYTEAYHSSYDRAMQLIRRKELFDVGREPAARPDRYGTHDFGRHCLLARRLLTRRRDLRENHAQQLRLAHGKLQFPSRAVGRVRSPVRHAARRPRRRGMLDDTLVVLLTEFGRTPKIMPDLGRDHYPKSWSVVARRVRHPNRRRAGQDQ